MGHGTLLLGFIPPGVSIIPPRKLHGLGDDGGAAIQSEELLMFTYRVIQ